MYPVSFTASYPSALVYNFHPKAYAKEQQSSMDEQTI